MNETNQQLINRKKIILIIKGLGVGGTERHLIGLIPRLAKHYEIEIFSFDTGSLIESDFNNIKFKSYQSETQIRKFYKRLCASLALYKILAKNREAIIHFFLPEPYLLGGLLAVFLGLPNLVMSRRSMNFYQKKHAFISIIEKFLHKKMRFFFANSRAVVQDLLFEGAPATSIFLNYNPIQSRPILSRKDIHKGRKKLGFGENELLIICVANLIKYKGHRDLLVAMAAISKRLSNKWKLVLVGRDDGERYNLQQQSEKLGLAKNVVFLGEMKGCDDYVSISDIGVLASHQEGFSNSVLEGMAAGLPMVVSDVGGNPEAVDDKINGLIVPVGDTDKLGNAILSLADNEEVRKKYGNAARLKVHKNFTWEKCINNYTRVYSSIFN